MKKIFLPLLIISASFLSAQVGIKTVTPRDALDVNGDILVEKHLVDELAENAAGNMRILVRSIDSVPVGKIKTLDVDVRNVGPVNKYTAIIENVNDDTVVNLVTNLPRDKYLVAITDANFSGAVSSQNSNGTYGSFTTEVTTVNRGGTNYNAVNLDFKGAGTINNNNGTWTISLLVYEKELLKDWGTVNGSVDSGANPVYSGVSSGTPAGLK